MVELNLANAIGIFALIGISLVFVIAWILKSESRINFCKDEIARLKERVKFYEREKFILLEKINTLKTTASTPDGVVFSRKQIDESGKGVLLDQSQEQISMLEEENKRLKAELDEARSSLEEVYKALSS